MELNPVRFPLREFDQIELSLSVDTEVIPSSEMNLCAPLSSSDFILLD